MYHTLHTYLYALTKYQAQNMKYEIDVDSQLIDAVLRGQRKLLLGD